MHKIILQNRIRIHREGLCLVSAVACTLGLVVTLLLQMQAGVQLCLFLILLVCSREQLQNGLDALSASRPNVNTLLSLSAFAALLHGIATATNTPYFAYSALSLTMSRLGSAVERRFFGTAASEQRIVDRFCRILVPTALLLFALTMTAWLMLGKSMVYATEFAAAVLIVSCPVPIGIVAPLVNIFAEKTGKKSKVLLASTDAVEKLGRVNTLIVEQPSVVYKEQSLYDLYAVDADKATLLAVAAAIEQRAAHPFAEAIVRAAAKLDLPMPCVTAFTEFRGRGVCAVVAGDKYFLGNKKLFREQGIVLPDAVRTANLGGHLPLYAAKNGSFCGMLLFGNAKKSDVSFSVEKLHDWGIQTYLRVKGGVLLLDRKTEKVLQEPQNGATIKKMLYGAADRKDAFCTADSAGHADILLPAENLYTAVCAVQLGKKAGSVLLWNLLLTFSGSAFCLLLAAGVLPMPFDSARTPALVLALSVGTIIAMLLHSLRLCRVTPPCFTPLEEDDMFGKIQYTMKIDGMSCAHCSARVKTALESLRGISAQISLEEKTARVKCPMSTDAQTLVAAVTDAGYTVLSCERV